MLTIDKRFPHLRGTCIVGAVVALSFIVEVCLGNFPVDIFRFPLNILVLALWMMLIVMMYRGRTDSACARFMLSREATWLALAMIVAIGITLGLQRKPSSTAWPVVLSLLFVQSHLLLVILRGWRNKKGSLIRGYTTYTCLPLAISLRRKPNIFRRSESK